MDWAPEMLALMIPILGIVMGISLAMLGLWLDYRRKREMFEMHHKERMAAIEKGIEVPALAPDLLQSRMQRPTPGDLLRRGLILLFVGMALVIAMSYEESRLSWWGLLPAAIGLAYLISFFVERRQAASGGTPNIGPLALCAALVAMAAFTRPAHADEYARTFPVTQRADVHVDTNDGSVRVVTSDVEQVEFHVVYSGLKLDKTLHIETHQTGGRIDLVARTVGGMVWSWGMSLKLNIEVRMPKDADLQVDTGDGSVDAALLAGTIGLHTGDGSIRADRLSGTLDLHTGDGGITVRALHGTVRLQTGDGSIAGTDLDGQFDATSGDGSIQLAGRFDGLRVKSGDGSIEARAAAGSRLNAGWHLDTGAGSVRMALPADLPADIDAQAGLGSVSLDVPVAGTVSRSEVRGKINGGGQPLTIHTGVGSIHVVRT
jgi:hypothetical protein